MGGFEYGVEAWNQNIDAIAKTQGWTNPQDHKVNFINLGQPDSFFSNSFSIGDGKPLVQALLQRGADAILPVAGPQTVDAVKEIKAYKSSCIVVGVDTAQEADTSTNSQSIYTDKSGDNKIIKFSATKNIANITSKILSLACAHIKNDLSYTNIGSFGWLSIGDIQNNGIQPSEPSWDYLVEFLESVTGNKPSDDKYDWIVKKLGELKDTGGGLGYFETLSDPDHMKFRI
jgi:basic membrane lipoprotein Med (substrate-binding protein (PBP1-ABC) superfamily)